MLVVNFMKGRKTAKKDKGYSFANWKQKTFLKVQVSPHVRHYQHHQDYQHWQRIAGLREREVRVFFCLFVLIHCLRKRSLDCREYFWVVATPTMSCKFWVQFSIFFAAISPTIRYCLPLQILSFFKVYILAYFTAKTGGCAPFASVLVLFRHW